MEPWSIYQHLTGVFDTLLTVSIAPDLWDNVTLPPAPVYISTTDNNNRGLTSVNISLAFEAGKEMVGGKTAWEGERSALERLGERMHEGREGRRVSWPGGRTVTGEGEGCWDPGEEALAQGQREGQSGGRPAQAREHVLGGPGGLSEVNHLVRES